MHDPQGRFSCRHVATETGTFGHGVRSSDTSALHSWRSRAVIALVSTPGSTISFGGALTLAEALGWLPALLALESRQLDHAPPASASANRLASWDAVGKADDL
jgi:hypothetical protein